MKNQYILFVLSYYYPHVSGLSNYVKIIAEGLAARGVLVKVVTNSHDKDLKIRELLNGVEIIRAPNAVRINKAIISPHFLNIVKNEERTARVVNIHYPIPEIYALVRSLKKPIIVTYHCDVSFDGFVGKIKNKFMDKMICLAEKRITNFIVNSDDYASHSRLKTILGKKLITIHPPCNYQETGIPAFRDGHGLHIGFLGRIVCEKGLDFLLDGFYYYNDPRARLLIGGDYKGIAGGSIINKLESRIKRDPRVKLLGFIPDNQLFNFYASIDIFALPSINAFESFGISQAEALMHGIPVIATNLPGVREPVNETGHGQVIQPLSSIAIRDAIIGISRHLKRDIRVKEMALKLYSADQCLDKYQNIFEEY